MSCYAYCCFITLIVDMWTIRTYKYFFILPALFVIAHVLAEGAQDILGSVVQIHEPGSTISCLGGLIGSQHIVVSESCLSGRTSVEAQFRNNSSSLAWKDSELSQLLVDGVIALRLQHPHTLKSGRYFSILPYTSTSTDSLSGSLSGNRIYWHDQQYAARGNHSSSAHHDQNVSAIQVAQYASDYLPELLLKRYKDRNVIIGIRGYQGDFLKKGFTRVYKVNPLITRVGRSEQTNSTEIFSGNEEDLPNYIIGVALGVFLFALELTTAFKAHHCTMNNQFSFPCVLAHVFTAGVFLLPCW